MVALGGPWQRPDDRLAATRALCIRMLAAPVVGQIARAAMTAVEKPAAIERTGSLGVRRHRASP